MDYGVFQPASTTVSADESNYAALGQLHTVICALPNDERGDYLSALQYCPNLLLTESNPTWFLNCTNWEVEAAGRRLAGYWKRRREAFGFDRAFLPLSLTGKGALSQEDIAVIRQGWVVFLPEDTCGRPVVCVDTSRRLSDFMASRLRAIFFHGVAACENFMSQTSGCVFLEIISDPKFDMVTKMNYQLVTDIIPIKVHAWHYFNCTPAWAQQGFTEFMINWMRNVNLPFKVHVHTTQRRDAIVNTLEKHGIGKYGLPECVGGLWSYTSFSNWVDSRLQKELFNYPTSFAATLSVSTLPYENGSTDALENDESKSFQSFRALLETAMEQLAQHDTITYCEARTNTPPAIWEKECNIDRFLRVESFNAWLAAKRLSKYWRVRSETFGSMRFLPLTQTGEGALRRKDLNLLQTGFIYSLPNDVQGSPVLWIDCKRLRSIRPMEMTRNRCLFYMFSILVEFEASQTSGAVLIMRMDTDDSNAVDLSFIQTLAECLPLRFKAAHFIFSESVDNPSKLVFNIAENCVIHNGFDRESLMETLEYSYFVKSGLPQCIGGYWDYSKFIFGKSCGHGWNGKFPWGRLLRNTTEKFSPRYSHIIAYQILSSKNGSVA